MMGRERDTTQWTSVRFVSRRNGNKARQARSTHMWAKCQALSTCKMSKPVGDSGQSHKLSWLPFKPRHF